MAEDAVGGEDHRRHRDQEGADRGDRRLDLQIRLFQIRTGKVWARTPARTARSTTLERGGRKREERADITPRQHDRTTTD